MGQVTCVTDFGRDTFWKRLSQWVILLTPEEAYPFTHGGWHHDPEDDVAQSAAVGTMLVSVCNAFRDGSRHQLVSPCGRKIEPGMQLKILKPKIVSITGGMLTDLHFGPHQTLTVSRVVHFIDCNKQPTGQHGFCSTEGFLLPVDWEFFRPIAA